MTEFKVTFKGEDFDVTVSGSSAEQIVGEYLSLREEISKILGSKLKLGKTRKSRPGEKATLPEGLPSKILELVHEGFFASPRKLQDIQEALRKKGVNKPVTTISARLTGLVQKQLLERDYDLEGNKKVWAYQKHAV